jgi:hypothetical protein
MQNENDKKKKEHEDQEEAGEKFIKYVKRAWGCSLVRKPCPALKKKKFKNM